jgi:hypothetical protein
MTYIDNLTDGDRQALHSYSMMRHNTVNFIGLTIVTVLPVMIVVALIIGFIIERIAPELYDKKAIFAGSILLSLVFTFVLYARMNITTFVDGLEYCGYFGALGLKPRKFIEWNKMLRFDIVEDVSSEGGITYNTMLRFTASSDARDSVNVGMIINIPFRKYSTVKWFRRFRGNRYQAIDVEKFLQSEFGQDIFTFAPHVIDAARSEQAAVEQETTTTTYKTLQ